MFKNVRQSLVTRLMLYFILVGFILVALFTINIAFGLKVHFKNEVLPNIAQYLIYIKDDIGSPPDLVKAKQLSQDLSLKIHIKSPEINWHSSDAMLNIQQLDFEVASAPYHQFKIAHRHKHNFVLLEEGQYRYYFSVERFSGSGSSTRYIALVTVVLVFLLLLFFAIRHSLKPLNIISRGVKDIATGNLNSNIQVTNSFEFEQLASGINAMSSEIKTMLEAKQQLLLAISHELRSPMTRAQVNLALLPEDDIQQALKHDLLEMEQLIALILESQRLNQTHAALNKTNFSLDGLIIETINSYFQSEIIQLSLTPTTIYADKTRLVLLIKNLIDNALKYSNYQQQAPHISLHKDDKQIVCVIKDYGIGMKPEHLNKITHAFYRVDQARQRTTGGFGLGLYLSQLIVKAHNGCLSFQSIEDEGTIATVKIPLDQA